MLKHEAVGVSCWGMNYMLAELFDFSWSSGALGQVPEIHDARMPGDEDLLDTAAVGAWRAGATVYVVPLADVPGETGVAAVFRY